MMISPTLIADPEDDLLVLGNAGVAADHVALNVHRATDRIDHAGEFHQHAVAGGFDDAAAVPGDGGIDQFAAMRLQRRDGAHLIGAHQAAVTNHIRRQNGCKPRCIGFLGMGLTFRDFARD